MLASIAMLSITSCDTLSQNADVVVDEDVRFILKEDAVDLTTASIRVRHTGSPDVMWVYLQTQDLDTPADELIEARVKNEYAFTNRIIAHSGSNKSLHLDGLEVKNKYRIIVKAIDKNGNLYGEPGSLIFKTRRNPNDWKTNDNWGLQLMERTSGTKNGMMVEYENYQCSSEDSESYTVLILPEYEWSQYAKGEEENIRLRTLFEDYHKDFLKQKDYSKNIFKGNRLYKEERRKSGDYVVFMIGLDEENELSGLYSQFEVEIKAETELAQSYKDWTGLWEISFTDEGHNPWNVVIDVDDPNMWFTSYGWEPERIYAQEDVLLLDLYYDKFTGKAYLISQEVALGDDGSSRICYYGAFPYGTKNMLVDYENLRIAEFVVIGDKEAQIRPLGATLDGVGEITFSYGLFYINYATSSTAASFSIPSFPWDMKKLAELDEIK